LVDRLAARGVVRTGARVVDLGTGTGSLARLFARHGCDVTAVDLAAPLLEQARRLDNEAGVEIAYRQARAEETGLPGDSFDVVSAGQCWHWFDRPAAAREVLRLLIPGGVVVIAHFDWLSIGENVVVATERVIGRHADPGALGRGPGPYSRGTGVYPQWLVDLQSAGFVGIETFSFDVEVPYSHEGWVGRVRASAAIAATLDSDGVRAFSEELAAALAEDFPENPLTIPHRVWAVTARAPS
jgi:SAM-dependent methyltransferase